MTCGMSSAKAIRDAYTKLTPAIVGSRIVVKPTTARAAPADMSLTLIETASNNETFFTSPVASLTKTGAFFEAIENSSIFPNVFNTIHESRNHKGLSHRLHRPHLHKGRISILKAHENDAKAKSLPGGTTIHEFASRGVIPRSS